jgi:germination protein M
MSWTTDRSISRNRFLPVIITAGVIFAAAAGGLFFWMRLQISDAPRNSSEQAGNTSALIQPAFRSEPLGVTLFYPLNGMLASGTVPVKRQPDTQAQAREALEAVFSDQRAAQAPVLRDVKLRAFYLDGAGTAYIDLLPGQQKDIRASAWEEQLAIYAMVNTLTQNFEEIRQVAFLVEGREAQTLAGHMDLARRYGKRMDLARQ